MFNDVELLGRCRGLTCVIPFFVSFISIFVPFSIRILMLSSESILFFAFSCCFVCGSNTAGSLISDTLYDK